MDADLIIVVKDGSIVEAGRHEGLLRRKGAYKELFDSQFDVSSDRAPPSYADEDARLPGPSSVF